jgi:hypothetical protein
MLPDLPDKLWHSSPVPFTARPIQQLDVMGRLRLFALQEELLDCSQITAIPLTLIFGTVGIWTGSLATKLSCYHRLAITCFHDGR